MFFFRHRDGLCRIRYVLIRTRVQYDQQIKEKSTKINFSVNESYHLDPIFN